MARLAAKLFRDVMPREIVSFVMVIRNYFGPLITSVSIIIVTNCYSYRIGAARVERNYYNN
jgi:hypothetical protein